uniref:Isopenicillin N synthase-like Fe(2+) 2OG dioxygenase domain-containing protein n=1 Tax=Solanum lycopersicum TaxID=4081 RepID=A0A3Q7I9K6_SOLLC|nr:flavanone 3-dioxygenase 3-like [Solanum lycopersicum]
MVPLEFVLPIPEGESPLMAIDGSIPVIDMSGLNGSDEQRLSTIHVAHWGFFRVLSNGKYKSVEHRAIVNVEEARISIAVGHGPKMDAIVQPEIPLIKEKSESKY